MPVTVRTGAAIKALLGGEREAHVEAASIAQVLDGLGIRDRVCESSGKVRRHFNIHINDGEDVRLLGGVDTAVADGDTVVILSAIAGGAETSRKVWLTFPTDMIDRPVIWEVGQKFRVVTNIRQASISKEIGIVGLEMSGEAGEIERAIEFIMETGVSVEPIELDVVE